MAKKKKTQLKPVTRGFATTSVPKKIVEPEEAPPASPDTEPTTLQDTVVDKSASNLQLSETGATPSPLFSHEFDPDKAEEQSLQNLVDRFQERTEKEVVRTIKAIEQEKRFARTLPRLDLEPAYIEQILGLILASEPSGSDSHRTITEPEDKVIPRLAATYGVLRRLGFSEGTVDKCLRSIRGVELDQAIEWLHIHAAEEIELSWNQVSDTSESRRLAKLPQTPQSPLASETPITPHTPAFSEYRLNARATSFTPSSQFSHPPSRDDTSLPNRVEQLGVSEGESQGASPVLSPLERRSPSQDSDVTASYVRLKMEIDELTTRRKPSETRDADVLRGLQRRLEGIKQDYLFDVFEAEEAYRIHRDKTDAAALEARLRGVHPHAPKEESPAPSHSKKLPPSVPPIDPDIFDEDSDSDTPGGLLGILQEMPATDTSEQGVTVQIRDIPPPKNWSGQTPRTLLQEIVRKMDRYADVTFRAISGMSRARRAAVRIRWDKGKFNEWTMEDIACYDLSQAEQYISTVALHALIFPSTEGFAFGGTSTGNQTSFRLLPPVYRDLWNEFEEKRRADDDAFNRSIWSKLRTILEPKLLESKVNGPTVKPSKGVFERAAPRKTTQSEISPEQIIAGFEARQASPSYQEMLSQRNTLPIAAYRQEIISTLETSQILVLSGETGCGKSTQVPSFILEDQLSQGKHCKIYCTEPRRISAISLAQRVSCELGEPPGAVGTLGSLVGYSIRLESNTSKTTRLTFVTNGIALRMLEGGSGQSGQGTAFDEITHIIIDEVHERTIESDFLLIVLKSLLKQRSDLKVILMSATLDAEKIANYFDGCPILQVPGRTYPVEVRYLEDAIEFTQWKLLEDSPYAIRGNDKYSRNKARADWSEDTAFADDDEDEVIHENVNLEQNYSHATAATINLLDERLVPYDLILRLLESICLDESPYSSYSSAILIFMPGMGEIRRLQELLVEHTIFASEEHFKIYPLHSTIASDQQAAVFDVPPPGIRKIVIATNIAETGITIPDITCVIDTGRHREMRFDEKRQLSRLLETFVAKSNAAQRRGRAGRVQRGLCFHLFTKIRYDRKMAEHPDPEMLRLSLSDLALRIKIMKVSLGSSIEDTLSRALDPPSSVNIQRAVAALVEVGALTSTEDITPMGRLLSKMPTDVHLGKFLLIASLFRCLDPALTIAATLNSKSPFLRPFGKEDEANRQKMSFRTDNSDFLTLHNAFSSWRRACANGPSAARKFCRTTYMSHQNLQQIEELRQQFLGYLVDSSFIQIDQAVVRDLNRARYSRNRNRFITIPPELDRNSSNSALIHAAISAGLYPKLLSIEQGKDGKDRLVTVTNNQSVSFHPSSVNFSRRPRDFGVNYLSYFTIMQSKKMYAWETGPADDISLLLLCGEAEFKLISRCVFVDRRIKFGVDSKSGIALKFLRTQLSSLLASQYRSNTLSESERTWNEIAMTVLGKIKPKEERKQETVTLVVNRILQ